MHTVPKCNVVMVAHVEGGAMDPAKFVLAVKATTRRHPQLRSIIDKASLSYMELEGFEPDENHYQVIEAPDADSWKAVVDKESNTPCDMYGPRPLWKVVLIKFEEKNVMLVCFHHCIGDGSSGYVITNDVLKFHQRLEEVGDVGDINPLSRLPSPEAMAFPDSDGVVPDAERPAVDALLKDFTRRRCEWRPRLAFDRTIGGEHNSTLYMDGTKESADALLARCRSKGLTVGAVLVAGTYFAIAKMDSEFRAQLASRPLAQFDFDFDMDVNLRKRLPGNLGNDHVGTIIGMMGFSLSMSGKTSFWDFVAEVRDEMTKAMESRQHLHYFDVNEQFDASSSDNPEFQDNLKRNDGLVQDMNFSSFGKYFFEPTYGKLQLTKLYCAGGGWCPTFGSCVFLIPTVTANNYTFVYSTNDTNAQIASDFFKGACDIIEMAHGLDDSYSLNDWLSA